MLAILQQEHDVAPAALHAVVFPQPTTVGYVHDGSNINPAIGLGNQKADNVRHNNKAPRNYYLGHAARITSVAYRSPAPSALSLTPR
ncbi:hypothetical protein ACN9MZ_17350 [Pseudoduganella sp. S-14]|uniref:hypothetical protein n=1 Tax=Pseudoduganella sp. S-14 TaxID=3404065 RepID=UPI003CEAEC2C